MALTLLDQGWEVGTMGVNCDPEDWVTTGEMSQQTDPRLRPFDPEETIKKTVKRFARGMA